MSRRRKLIKVVVPSILSMVSFFLFTVIDGIFVGSGVGTDALGAINIVYPYVMVFNAFCMLFMMGGTTIMAIRIGRKDSEGANRVFMHSFVLVLLISIIASAAAVFFTEPICRALGANDTFINMASDYLFWYGVFFIPVGVCIGLNGFCRNDNDPVLVSMGMIIATSFNIFADWLFIFPLNMGLKGAAIATGIAQVIQLAIVMTHFIRKKGILRIKAYKPDMKLVKMIVIRGLPECVAQFSVPVSTIVTNQMLVRFVGDVGVNAYSVICYIAAFSVAVFAGTAEGLQPLFGNCYGSGNEKDMKYYFRRGMAIGVIGSILILVLLWFTDEGICALYAVNAQTLDMTLNSMFKYSWGFVMQAVNVIISAYLYSTTRTKAAILINALRSFVVNIAVIIILPMLFPGNGVWFTFGVYEGIVMIVSIILKIRCDRNGVIGAALE